MSNAFVLINCELNQEEDIIEKLQKIRNVEDIQKTMGAYDVVVKLKAEDNNKLKDTIKDKIQEIKNVQHTLTLMELIRA